MTLLRNAIIAAALVAVTPALAQVVNPGSLLGRNATLSAGFMPDPYDASLGTVGGSFPSRTLSPMCLGYSFSQRPDFALRYTAGGGPLYIGATSSADTTLLVRAPDGFYCDDDSGEGVNPLVSLQTPSSGTYDIWIGRIDAGPSVAATLHFSEIPTPGQWSQLQAPRAAPTPAAQPDYTLPPTFGVVSLVSNFQPSPFTRRILAGGDIDLQPAMHMAGFVARAPDFSMSYHARVGGDAPLIFSVTSNADTILLINDPAGHWHYDDDSAGGRDPRVRIENPSSGRYDIWVGTFRQVTPEFSTLSISQEWNYPPIPQPR